MQAFKVAWCVGLLTSSLVAVTYATVGGQYSVNVHFVPPLVTASCQVAQFWTPPNVTCALCFCMTGTLSRCIPRPGCNPQEQNSSTTTHRPGNSTEAAGGNTNPPGDVTEGPTTTPAAQGVPDAAASSSAAPPAAEASTEAAAAGGAKVRAPKPLKARRKRLSRNIGS